MVAIQEAAHPDPAVQDQEAQAAAEEGINFPSVKLLRLAVNFKPEPRDI